uniref:hypothetical protein n=1 Tax=uncultured Draconibacterium sp. TaxID=1573823 RepID=UPI003217F14C
MKEFIIIGAFFLIAGCASIPKETVLLSETLGNDLLILHRSHRNIVDIHYEKIEKDINSLIDDVYAPFVIHYVLKTELKKFNDGIPSLYGAIDIEGKREGKEESKEALDIMQEFLEAAREQIESKRNDLLLPIKKQKSEILRSIDQSYENAIYANTTVTAYLKSLRKLKDTQQEVLTKIGLDGVDGLITDSLMKFSEEVEKAVKVGKKIDIESDDAFNQIEKLTNQIKELTN